MKTHIVVLGMVLPLWSSSLLAQQVPDAGTLLREQPKPPPSAPSRAAPIAPPSAPAAVPEAGPRFLVKGFQIEGAVLIPAAELAAQLKPYLDRELAVGDLKAAADILSGYYAAHGYIARVVIPPQDIKDGIVRISVIEGRRGSLHLDNQGKRIAASRVEGMIDYRTPGGQKLDLVRLREAVALLNEQPGVQAAASLAPGKAEAEIDLVVRTNDKPLWSFNANANNQGARATGIAQIGAGATLNNPTGNFDSASLLISASDGLRFSHLDYGLALGNSGLRAGANLSQLNYHLTQPGFAALQSRGSADTAGLALSYPIARRASFNLSLTGAYDNKRLVDNTVAGETGKLRVSIANLGVAGYSASEAQGSSVTNFSAGLSAGNTSQKNAGALAADALTRQTEGHFLRLNYSAGQLWPLGRVWSLNPSLRGQLANKNLASSERFSLGGPNAVRAYPVSEAVGDTGWVFSLAAIAKMKENLSSNLFFDAGGISLNQKTWANWNAANPSLPNHYTLRGVGVGVDWRFAPQALLSLAVATPLGDNPGRDLNNRNIDGSRRGTRAWINLAAQF